MTALDFLLYVVLVYVGGKIILTGLIVLIKAFEYAKRDFKEEVSNAVNLKLFIYLQEVESLRAENKVLRAKLGEPEPEYRKKAKREPSPKSQIDIDLRLFGLASIPTNRDDLNRIRKQLLMKNHPDRGGSVELAKDINTAYDRIRKLIPA